jgi:hypothetical protein
MITLAMRRRKELTHSQKVSMRARLGLTKQQLVDLLPGKAFLVPNEDAQVFCYECEELVPVGEVYIIDTDIESRSSMIFCSLCDIASFLQAVDSLDRESERRKSTKRHRLGAAQQWRCYYCHEQGTENSGADQRTWHVDHVYAKALGGDSKEDNLVLACATCNLKKNHKLVSDFLGIVPQFRSVLEWGCQ